VPFVSRCTHGGKPEPSRICWFLETRTIDREGTGMIKERLASSEKGNSLRTDDEIGSTTAKLRPSNETDWGFVCGRMAQMDRNGTSSENVPTAPRTGETTARVTPTSSLFCEQTQSFFLYWVNFLRRPSTSSCALKEISAVFQTEILSELCS
jgi:hypothetical protein